MLRVLGVQKSHKTLLMSLKMDRWLLTLFVKVPYDHLIRLIHVSKIRRVSGR